MPPKRIASADAAVSDVTVTIDPSFVSTSTLRDGVSPLTAIMVVTRFFIQYFAVEVAFRVPNHFGKDSNEAIKDIVDVLKFGILKP